MGQPCKDSSFVLEKFGPIVEATKWVPARRNQHFFVDIQDYGIVVKMVLAGVWSLNVSLVSPNQKII